MEMQMWHALADHVVRGDERSLTAECAGHDRTQALYLAEEGLNRSTRQVRQRRHMPQRGDEDVSLENWPDVEERHDVLIGKNDVRRYQPGRDIAEQAVADGFTFQWAASFILQADLGRPAG